MATDNVSPTPAPPAEVLPDYDNFLTKGSRIKAARYLDGRTYRLRPGRDFPPDAPLKNVQAALYGMGKRLGLTVRTRRETDPDTNERTIVVKATKGVS